MNMRRNCGVFDELTKKCIACGELQEGEQCKYIMWSLPQTMYHAAQLIGVPVVLEDFNMKVLIVSDSPSLRAYGPQFDPARNHSQLHWLTERLLTHCRCRIQYNGDSGLYEVLTDKQGHAYDDRGTIKLYNLNTRHRLLAVAIIMAAAKHYCMQSLSPIANNLMEDKL